MDTATASRIDRDHFGRLVRDYRANNPGVGLMESMEACARDVANRWLQAGYPRDQIAEQICQFHPGVADEVRNLRAEQRLATTPTLSRGF